MTVVLPAFAFYRNFFFSVLSLKAGGGTRFVKSQAEFPLLFAVRAGECVTHPGLAGIPTDPGVSLEADGTSLQDAVVPERAAQPPLLPHWQSVARTYLA